MKNKILIKANLLKLDIYDLSLGIDGKKILNQVFEGNGEDKSTLKFNNVLYTYDHSEAYTWDEEAKQIYNNLEDKTQGNIKCFGDEIIKKIDNKEIEEPKNGLEIGEYKETKEDKNKKINDLKDYSKDKFIKLINELNKEIQDKEREILNLTADFDNEQKVNDELIKNITAQQKQIKDLKIQVKEYELTLEKLNPKVAKETKARVTNLIKKK